MSSRWEARQLTAPTTDRGGGGPLTVLSEVFVERRSAQAVWDCLRTVEAIQQVSPCMVSIEAVEGTGPGVGLQTKVVHRHGQRSEFLLVECLEEHPPAFLASRTTTAGRAPTTQRVWIEHTGAGCRMREQYDVELAGVTTPAQREAHRAAVQQRLDSAGRRWKQLLETGRVDPLEPDEH